MKSVSFLFCPFLMLWSCADTEEPADLILINAEMETLDERVPPGSALAIKDGRILAVGSNEELLPMKTEQTEVIDLEGNYLMPGFIEGHGHFEGLGQSKLDLYVLQSQSWEEVLDAVEKRAAESDSGQWITGRGWHQEKWSSMPEESIHSYPVGSSLDSRAPDNPVMLKHASGHALIANTRAMELAGVSRETPDPAGGRIIRDADGSPTGIFEENAMDLIESAHSYWLASLGEEMRLNYWLAAVDSAQAECLRNGVTSFHDAGCSMEEADRYFDLALKGQLDTRLYLMLRHDSSELSGSLDEYRKVGLGDGFLSCRAIKVYMDGALGSFGAWLLESYSDKPGHTGHQVTEIEEIEALASLAAENDMQLCVHAIGDRANRECLDVFEKYYQKYDLKDPRWRIEHAQHIDTADIARFGKLGVIASVQAIHCTSDAPFVHKRLGEFRARETSYPRRTLLDKGAELANGTDSPIEEIDPLANLYASVSRRPVGGKSAFYPQQSMSRREALLSLTLWNARAAFEEELKGTITPGKYADLVVLDTDLMSCPEDSIPKARVLYTIINGKVGFKAGQ